MPISNNHQLTHDQFRDLTDLAQRCKKHDSNITPIYNDLLLRHRTLPSNVLYYHHNKLIGFLSAFFFYDDACELILMVDPAWRRQRIATQLLATILPILHSRETENVFCASPEGLNDAWFSTRGLVYRNREIQMQWMKNRAAHPIPSEISFYQSTSDADIPLLTRIDMACFDTEKEEMEARFHRLLRDETYQIYVIELNNQAIGKAHVHHETGQLQLSDIAILPLYQRRGFGEALVRHCIEQAPHGPDYPLRLCVESTNPTALHLYERLGFKIINTWDFWTISTVALHDCIKSGS